MGRGLGGQRPISPGEFAAQVAETRGRGRGSKMPRWLLFSLTFAGLFPLRRWQLRGSSGGREGCDPAGSPAPLRPPAPASDPAPEDVSWQPSATRICGPLPEGAPWRRAPLSSHLRVGCGARTREERAAARRRRQEEGPGARAPPKDAQSSTCCHLAEPGAGEKAAPLPWQLDCTLPPPGLSCRPP
ncbi:small membrane A-kinase anchor protein isoform X1 [Cebus imitator]|uniref:small membrane A-kinase anchor protein isoform X1 n=1 Tax=Cebus imitator TaxID=2715852 RepID=UPI000809B03C|nr:small membrane A-kinase anchor protein isoform X1 [Cebus imitator]